MLITIITSMSAILAIFISSFLIGRYIQNRFFLFISNTYISFAIGFSVYIAIITLLFMPVVFFAWPILVLVSVFWIFNIFLIIFFILSWKVINIKNTSIKQIFIFIILALILIITTRFLYRIPNSGNNYFFIKWIRTNLYTNHINDGIGINKYHFGEGWYYFQTIILKTTNIDQTFMNFWIIGTIVNLFIVSVMFGFVYLIIKNNKIHVYMCSIGILILISWFMYNGESENIGTIPFIWNYILLITILLNFLIRPKIYHIYLLAIINYAGWSFDSMQLFMSIPFILSASIILLFKKSHLLVEFVIIFSYSIIIMLNIFLFNISYIGFSILFFLSICWAFITFYIVNYNINICREYSVIFIKKKWWIFSVILIIIIGISMIILISNYKDSWRFFKYDSISIVNLLNKNTIFKNIILYLFYWLSILIISITLFIMRKRIFENEFSLLMLSSGLIIILFFNPFVSALWGKVILSENRYFLMQVPTLLVIFILFPIFISKIKLASIINLSISFISTAMVFTLYATNSFILDNLSLYNGLAKDTKELGEYINNKQVNKRMTGDTDGLMAYVNNDLSFPVHSKSFNLLRYNKLTNDIYSKVDNSKVDLLIKLRVNIGNFQEKKIYSSYNFKNYIYVGNYELFYK